jgi:MraZ protein
LLEAGKALVLTAHPDGCVLIYPALAWEPVRTKVESFPSFNPQASWWKRLLLGFEEHVSADAAGRLLLPSALRMHAKLERDAMMVGQGHYFELWDSGIWNAKLSQALAGAAAPPPGIEDFSL